MVAREHGHCGWANTTSVDSPGTRPKPALCGQSWGGAAKRPGVFEYRNRAPTPTPTAGIHNMTAIMTPVLRVKRPHFRVSRTLKREDQFIPINRPECSL